MVAEQGLSERKLKILHAIIQTYLETDHFQIYGYEFKFRYDPQ